MAGLQSMANGQCAQTSVGKSAKKNATQMSSRQRAIASATFTITTEIRARLLANLYCQYADRHINLKFMRRVSERERAIRQFVIVKDKLMSVLNASVLLLTMTMNFVITLSK